MSVYIPTNWVNNTTPAINEDNLNHLEAGVQTAHREIEELIDGTTKAAKAARADSSATVDVGTQTITGGAKIWVDDADVNNIIGYIDAR